MAYIKALKFLNGFPTSMDPAADSIALQAITLGGSSGTELTKAQLDTLIANSFSQATLDGRYAQLSNLSSTASGKGAALVGIYGSFTNFTPTASTVQGALEGIDSVLATGSGRVKVSATDTTSEFLSASISAGAALGSAILNPGANETLDLFVKVDDSSIEIDGIDALRVKALGITSAMLAGSIDAAKIGDGSVSTTEFHYLDGVTSSIQDQLDAKLPKAGGTMTGDINMNGHQVTGLAAPTVNGDALRFDQLGANNGIATLDSGGKVPVSQLPNSVMEYKGTYDASTNTPDLYNGDVAQNTGNVYKVTVAGSRDFGAGAITFVVGDYAIYNGTVFEKAHSGADAVISVNGDAGAVTVNAINQLTGDVTATAATASQSKATTVAKIQGETVTGTTGSGNVVFSASPTFTGTVSGITATMVGLGNVTNDAQLKAADLDTDNTLAADSDTKIASQKAVKYYVDNSTGNAANKSLSNLTSPTAVNQDLNMEAHKINHVAELNNTSSALSWLPSGFNAGATLATDDRIVTDNSVSWNYGDAVKFSNSDGNITAGVIYYVRSIDISFPERISVSTTVGGFPVTMSNSFLGGAILTNQLVVTNSAIAVTSDIDASSKTATVGSLIATTDMKTAIIYGSSGSQAFHVNNRTLNDSSGTSSVRLQDRELQRGDSTIAIDWSGADIAVTGKITGLTNGAAASQDAATVSQMETAIGAIDLTPYFKKDGSVAMTGGIKTSTATISGAAIGTNFVALGSLNTISGNVSVAMGRSNISSGDSSFAMGRGNTASGAYSVAMGQNNTASNTWAAAIGHGSTASGTASVALNGSTATGNLSMAANSGQANGTGSFAAVSGTATGQNSTAMGYNVVAESFNQTTLGQYNLPFGGVSTSSIVSTDPLFVLGNGTGTGSEDNALVVLKNAKSFFKGQMDLGANKIVNLADGTAASQDAATVSQMETADNLRVAKAGSTMDSNADITFAGGGEVLGLPSVPSVDGAAASKKYVDDQDALKLSLTGGTMTGAIAMSGHKITGLTDGTAGSQDAATVKQMNDADDLKLNLTGGTLTGTLTMSGATIAMGSQKITGLAAGSTSGDAVEYGQLAAFVAGAVWLSPIMDANLIDATRITSFSGTNSDTYIAAATGGAWTAGHVYQWDGVSAWNDILGRVVAIGDRFGISMETSTTASDTNPLGTSLTGNDDRIATVTGVTPGAQWSFAFTFETPAANHAVYVNNPLSHHSGHQYNYSGSQWNEFGGLDAVSAGLGLSLDGNALNINMGAGIIQLPSDEVGVDVHPSGGLMTTLDNSASDSTTAAQLAIKLDGSTLDKSSFGLKVATGGIANNEISNSAAINATKIADGSVSNAEFQYINSLSSNAQDQIDAKLAKALASAHIFVGNGSGVAADVAMSGEASISNTGAVTLNNAAVIGKLLTGYSAFAGTISSSDSILSAVQKLDGNMGNYLPLAGGTMLGSIDMGAFSITGIGSLAYLGSIASGSFAVALGDENTASGNGSVALGYQTNATADTSTAMGSGTQATNYASTAMGYGTASSGIGSTAMGWGTNATADASTAMGSFTTASGPESTAMGANTTASGPSSTATGYGSTASGDHSFAAGNTSIALGNGAVAMGDHTNANGAGSIATGNYTTAGGLISTAMGNTTSAIGHYSTSMGLFTTANSVAQITAGKYNLPLGTENATTWVATDPLFVLGNGTGIGTESNALMVRKNGNAVFSGTLAASNLSGTNTGDVTLTAIGAVPNNNGASLSGQALTLQPADATHGGVVTTGAQTFAGAKTFNSTISGSIDGNAATSNAVKASNLSEIAGEQFLAGLYAVRYAQSTETVGSMYKADNDTFTFANDFYVIGLVKVSSTVAAAAALPAVTKVGLMTVTGHGFTVGRPVYLDAAGALTSTLPTLVHTAIVRIGMVKDANTIDVQIQIQGIN